MKKVISLVLALVMIMSLAIGASAATITISGTATVPVTGKTLNAYQILEAEVITSTDDSGNETTTVVYTVPEALVDFYASYWTEKKMVDGVESEVPVLDRNSGNFDYQVAQKIAEMESNSDALFAFAKSAIAAAKAANEVDANSVKVKTATIANDVAKIAVGDDLGYYVIEDATTATTNGEPISALMVDSVTADMVVQLKAEEPPVNKNIDTTPDVDDYDNKTLVKFNNTSFGDKVPYIVDSVVPTMTGYTKYFFVLNDTMSKGLSFNNDVVVWIDANGDGVMDEGESLTKCACLDADEDGTIDHTTRCYTVTYSGSASSANGTSIKIVFNNFIQYKDDPTTTDIVEGLEGKKIYVVYSANVTKDAVVGVEGNPNEVTLTYSNNPNVTPTGDNEPSNTDPKGITPKKVTETYVTDIILEKVDPSGKPLTGATFKISGTRMNTVVVKKTDFVPVITDASTQTQLDQADYYALKDGTFTVTNPADVTDKSNYVDPTGETTYIKIQEVTTVTKPAEGTYEVTATVDENGKLEFEGLGAGDYTITETQAPNGYNLLEGAINLTIGWTAPDLTDDDTSNDSDCTWSYSWSTADTDDANKVNATNNNTNTIKVVNNTGASLPSTGGMGTTLFYVFGAVMVLGAAVLLVTKKRMTAE